MQNAQNAQALVPLNPEVAWRTARADQLRREGANPKFIPLTVACEAAVRARGTTHAGLTTLKTVHEVIREAILSVEECIRSATQEAPETIEQLDLQLAGLKEHADTLDKIVAEFMRSFKSMDTAVGQMVNRYTEAVTTTDAATEARRTAIALSDMDNQNQDQLELNKDVRGYTQAAQAMVNAINLCSDTDAKLIAAAIKARVLSQQLAAAITEETRLLTAIDTELKTLALPDTKKTAMQGLADSMDQQRSAMTANARALIDAIKHVCATTAAKNDGHGANAAKRMRVDPAPAGDGGAPGN